MIMVNDDFIHEQHDLGRKTRGVVVVGHGSRAKKPSCLSVIPLQRLSNRIPLFTVAKPSLLTHDSASLSHYWAIICHYEAIINPLLMLLTHD